MSSGRCDCGMSAPPRRPDGLRSYETSAVLLSALEQRRDPRQPRTRHMRCGRLGGESPVTGLNAAARFGGVPLERARELRSHDGLSESSRASWCWARRRRRYPSDLCPARPRVGIRSMGIARQLQLVDRLARRRHSLRPELGDRHCVFLGALEQRQHPRRLCDRAVRSGRLDIRPRRNASHAVASPSHVVDVLPPTVCRAAARAIVRFHRGARR